VRTYLKKNPSQIRAGGVPPGVGLEFKPQCQKKKKERKKKKKQSLLRLVSWILLDKGHTVSFSLQE
jgi:hypothetical protein